MRPYKERNLQEGLEAIDVLIALDFDVRRLTETHYRVNGRLDLWPTTRRYYDILSKQKGRYGDLAKFVRDHFENVKSVHN